MFDRWTWGKAVSARLVSRSQAAVALAEADYTAALLNGMPPAAMVHSVQLDTQIPVAVDWQLEIVSGAPWPPAGPTAPIYSALPWSGSSLFQGSQPVAAVYVEWSVNGILRWQICDAHDRGKLVLGAADWVRVYYLQMAGAGDGAPNIRVVVRPAEGGERSHARVSITPFKATVAAPSTVLAYLGAMVDEVQVDQSANNTGSLVGFAFLTAGLAILTSHVDLSANNPALGSWRGPPKNVLWRGRLPPSATYIQTGTSLAASEVYTSVVGYIR